MDYDAFGGVVVFDSTYRVNKYNLPFVPFIGVNHHRSMTVFGCGIVSDETRASYVWLLKAFLESAQQNHPRSVITDGDRAMAKAISLVFPNADHRLCSWHIEQNMIRHLRKTKLSDFRKFVYFYRGVNEFESRWAEFLEEYEISEKDAWITRMYELRKKWSRAYTKGRYFLGMQSNQRSESLNSRIHKNLDRRMSLVDLIEHTDHCLWRIRKNETELDATASQTVPFTELNAEPLERSAAHIYTPAMFKRVKHHIVQLPKWEVANVTKQDTSVVYSVALKERRDVTYDVKLIMAGPLLQSVNCRCLKMETEEIPCTHIFSVLKYLGLISIPSCCISRRWTMLAKPAFESERNANMHDWSERMDRYHELRNMSNLFLFKASSCPESRWSKFLDFLI
jgi:zinc finger SWIM domain-containing protein 3